MTTPKGWDTAEAERLHEYGFLHSLRCLRDEDGELACVCTPARARDTWDNDCTEGDSVAIESRRPGARHHPPAPGRSASSRVIR